MPRESVIQYMSVNFNFDMRDGTVPLIGNLVEFLLQVRLFLVLRYSAINFHEFFDFESRHTLNILLGKNIYFPVLSKESAFVHAIASASVLHTLSRSCDSGFSHCPCLHKYEFDQGICSSSIRFALRYGRKFIDAREKVSTDTQSIVNLHNNRVGRRVSFWYYAIESKCIFNTQILRKLQKKLCKCIGTSGSCIVRQCWKKNPPLRQIGYELRLRYDRSRKIITKDGRIVFNRNETNRNNLIYLENSPDYCSTAGRICTLNNCDKLCCGRGFKEKKVERKNKCNCIFKWCCEVVCEVCSDFLTQTICNG